MPSVPSLSDNGCKTRLLRHLDQCIAEIETEICPHVNPVVTIVNASTPSSKSSNSDKTGYKKHDIFLKKETFSVDTQ